MLGDTMGPDPEHADDQYSSESEEEAFSDELSSSPSIPDADTICFDEVYALHTFLATVEGQASVSKGDNLTLLDDSNSYWWLVRVLKTQAVGYIPAENIETPFERLARLNKHRNVDLSSATHEDHATGQGSAQARTRIVPPQFPSAARSSPYQGPPGGKSVAFSAPTYFEHSGNEESDEADVEMDGESGDDYDRDDMDGDVDDQSDDSADDEAEARRLASHTPDAATPSAQMSGATGADAEASRTSPSNRPVDPLRAGGSPAPFAPDNGTRKITLTPQIARDARTDADDPISPRGDALARDRTMRLGSQDSMVSDDAGSSEQQHGSLEDSGKRPSASKEQGQRKLRKINPPASATDDTADAKRKKGGSGGVFGFFKKKDKSRGDGASEDSVVAPATTQPVAGGRDPALAVSRPDDGEDDYLSDITMRQQQVEARQALYSQYGISRGAGDTHNTFVARSSSLNAHASTALDQTPTKPMRPGSLIGSPAATGDAPLLSVLRVFAGEDVDAEATFKTVLLNNGTTAQDLLRQCLQRFRLPLLSIDEYYLSIKNLAMGEEHELRPDQLPLPLLERLNEDERDGGFPSVKRSSVGSISSLSSNLSLHPAIERLGMNDFSDDSAVKLYLHCRLTAHEAAAHASDSPTRSPSMSSGLAASMGAMSRFSARIILQHKDLPDGLTFDPTTLAVVPRDITDARRAGPADQRECIIPFPVNVTVAEAVEGALDRFGILGGVVHGGDEVDKSAKRRSMTRTRYCLLSGSHAQDSILAPSAQLLDAYTVRPAVKQIDRTSRESRRRSLEVSPIPDVQDTDPIFYLRNYALVQLDQASAHGPSLAERPRASPGPLVRATTSDSVYATPSEELPSPTLPDATRQEIAAQRAASRASQRAILSARKNTEQGIDIQMSNKATIRSSRVLSSDRVRYSYIDQDGTELDISDIVEHEWSQAGQPRTVDQSQSTNRATPPISLPSTTGASANSLTEGSGHPSGARSSSVDQRIEERGIRSPPAAGRSDGDFLEDALERQRASPYFDETLEQRIDRVLAKVKSNPGGPAGFASLLRQQRSPDLRASPNLRGSAEGTPNGAAIDRNPSKLESSPLQPISSPLYRLDRTVDDLVTLVLHAGAAVPPAPSPVIGADLYDLGLPASADVQTRKWFGSSLAVLDTLETRLSQLALELVALPTPV